MEEYECKNKAMPLHAKRRPKESEGGSEIGRKKEREGERETKVLNPRNMVLLCHFAGFLYCANVQHFVLNSMEMQQIE